eukprot:CAMPEP_0115877844 /NCGR_PEP_ID=MMETSP0287-20121206/26444_1 /TAXON_ID=412157 /ORGANISM="Chrysochromulina rotalis, Strain UIO044" /LENGTH=225 /DNA_ID=CAMNT_0003333395 /DNA_START=34 /DNA_END=708 /DNA_ORIENTATION=+
MELDLGAELQNVQSFVDDDLLSCFLWAAGENAVAQPGWESPSVTPLQGIPLPPNMPPLPQAGFDDDANSDSTGQGPPPMKATFSGSMLSGGGGAGARTPAPASVGDPDDDSDDDEAGLGAISKMDDADIDDIGKMSVPLSKEQKLTQRMQRKAESARVARLRKKEYVGGLEEQIKDLTAALAAAREANKNMGAEAAAQAAAGGQAGGEWHGGAVRGEQAEAAGDA